MADIRINALATTAASTASDDFVAVDGSANGTRKLNAYSPTFGGNLTVSGTASSFGGFANAGGAIYVRKDSGEIFRADAAGAGYRIVADQNGVDLGGARTTVGGNLTVNGTGTNYFVGDITSTATGNNQWQITKGAATNYATLAFSETTSGAAWAIGQRTTAAAGGANRFSFYGSGVGGDAMQITYLGNVLIGTTADGGQKLQVSGTAAISGNLSSGARITAGNGFTATSTVPTVLAASTNLDYNSGTSKGRLFIWGPDSGTIAGFEIKLANSTNSSIIDAVSFDSSGNATFAGKVGIGVSPSSWELNLQQSATNSAVRIISPTALGLNDSSIYIAWASGSKALIAASYESTGSYRPLVLSAGGVDSLTLDTSGNATFAGNIKTAAPSGGTAATWRLGTVASVSPTSPNRTIEVEIGGTTYYIHAKTTNN